MMKHEVFWKNPHHQPFPYLNASTSCEYLIVGGGITGVSLAYFLAGEGIKNVILVERNMIASGATGNAAGSLVASAEIDLSELVHKHGVEKSLAHWKMVGETLNDIKSIIKKEKIPCDFEEQDTMYCSLNEKHEDILHEEYDYVKKLTPTAKIIQGKELKKELNSPLFTKSIFSPKSGVSVNPMQLTQNLARVVAKKGIQIFEHTPVLRVSGNTAVTPHGTITFKKIIWAIDAAHPNPHVKNNKTTILITRPLTTSELKRTGLNKKKIIWDTNQYYGYAKVTKDNRLLIGIGDTKVGKNFSAKNSRLSRMAVAKSWLNRLFTYLKTHIPHTIRGKRWLRQLFPYLKINIEYVWSATYGTTENHRPLIEQKGNTYAFAAAGSQVICVMAAHQLARKIAGKTHQFDLVYL